MARLGLTRREIQTAVLVVSRSKKILVWFKMVLKYRDKEISSLRDIQNLTAKDLREILRYHFVLYNSLRFPHCFATRSPIDCFPVRGDNARQDLECCSLLVNQDYTKVQAR